MGSLGTALKQMVGEIQRSRNERFQRIGDLWKDTQDWLKRSSSDRRRQAQEAREGRARWFGEMRSFVKDMRSRTQARMSEYRNDFAEARRAWASLSRPPTGTPSSGPSPSGEEHEGRRKKRKGSASEE